MLDGELVVLDEAGRPSFNEIQKHEHAATLMLFDVLRLDGRDVTSLPWRERRALLDKLALAGGTWQTPKVVEGDADLAVATARALGMEGVVAKRTDAPYRPGKRTTAWQKYKLSARQELVVGGWLPGEGRLSGTVGSLLVGYHDEPGGTFRYAGRVGSGIDDAGRDALQERLVRRDSSPFAETPPRLKGPVWVEPDVVVEVEVHRVDDRRRPAPARLPRPPHRQGPRRRHPRMTLPGCVLTRGFEGERRTTVRSDLRP